MAISLDVILNFTIPMWLEASVAVVLALALALTKICLRSPTGQQGQKAVHGHKECAAVADARASHQLGKRIEAEVEAGHNADAVSLFHASGNRLAVPVEVLPYLVRAFLDTDPDGLVAAIMEHVATHAASLATPKAAAAVLDSVARNGKVEIMQELADGFHHRLHIPRGPAFYEALLGGFAIAGCSDKVAEIVEQLKSRRHKVTVRGYSLIIKGFLRSGLIDDALAQIAEMRFQGFHLPSFAVAELFRAAREAGRVEEVMDRALSEVTLNTDAVCILLEDCVARQDQVLADRVRDLAQKLGLALSPGCLEALLRLYASAGDVRALEIFEELRSSGSLRLSEAFCVGILTRCADSKFLRLAEDMARCARAERAMTVTLYSALMKVYAYCNLYGKACDLYKLLRADGLEPDAVMYGCLLKFAVESGHTELLKEISHKVDSLDVQNCMSLIRAAGQAHDLDQAFEYFEKLKAAGVKMDVPTYNCLVDACANAGDMRRARMLLSDMQSMGQVDKVSYNTIMKGYCMKGDSAGAKATLKEMDEAGFPPNDITFNSLINMAVTSGNMSDAWSFVDEMQSRGLPLDKYTICTMLKSLRRSNSPRRDTERVLALLDSANLDIFADEVLLNMVLDTCIRQCEHHRLENILKNYKMSTLRPAAHTYGSLIRACSTQKRVDDCRKLWVEMVEDRAMEPNTIVLGCMLDALVVAGCVQEAVQFFHKWKSHVTINSVLYSTLMKGFAASNLPDEAMNLFYEMRAAHIRPTTMSYNTVADAQARVGNAEAVMSLVELMEEDHCKPDHVTHSIIVKAYCMTGELDRGYQVFRTMRRRDAGVPTTSTLGSGSSDGSVTIAFNTLLDGCVRHNKFDLADNLLEQLEEFGVVPTNFTLCILLKMCGRRRQLARAMRAAEIWPKRYGFQANTAVKTCLMCACIKSDSVESAFKVFDDVKASGCADVKAYGVLLNGCVRHGALKEAVKLVEEAYGLDRTDGKRPGEGLEMHGVEQLIVALANQGLGESVGAPLLHKLRSAGVTINARMLVLSTDDHGRRSNTAGQSRKAHPPRDRVNSTTSYSSYGSGVWGG